MEGTNIQKTKAILHSGGIYLTMAVAFVVMMILYPVEGKFKYQFKKGSPWTYETLTAPIDFPLLKTQQELMTERNDAAANIVPYYKLNASVFTEKIKSLSETCLKQKVSPADEAAVADILRKFYSKGILPDRGKPTDKAVFIQSGRNTSQEIESDLYTVSKAKGLFRSEIEETFKGVNSDSLMTVLDIQSLIVSNLVYDKKTTELLHKKVADYISPSKGMIYTGQLIVTKGETVTSDIEQLLDSYKAEYKRSLGYSGTMFSLITSHALIVLLLIFMLYTALYFSDSEILRKQNQFNFVMFIFCLNFIVPMLVRNISPEYLYLIPCAVTTLYMSAFLRTKVVIPVYLISLLPMMLVAENGPELYVLNALSGTIALLSFSYLGGGWMQFINTLFIFFGLSMMHIGFALLTNGGLFISDWRIIFYLFLNAMLTVATYPFVFLFEKMFYMVSVATLKDLSDTSNPLLRELSRKAPGTFQHSLQVANLAERAVSAIGGNVRLVRVGALYHDIGKSVNPQAFIENQAPGFNIHDTLPPQESSELIIKHVDDGVFMAKKANLPQSVVNFISSHHGHSMTAYFYNVYCNNGGDPKNTAPFTYRGTLPVSKEEVIVMMADAVEAASRTLKDFSPQSISDLVENVLRSRLSPDQLAKAEISFRDINITKMVFKRQLQDMYHARIVYPKRKA